jgi:hypothetical protein
MLQRLLLFLKTYLGYWQAVAKWLKRACFTVAFIAEARLLYLMNFNDYLHSFAYQNDMNNGNWLKNTCQNSVLILFTLCIFSKSAPLERGVYRYFLVFSFLLGIIVFLTTNSIMAPLGNS